MGSFRHHAVIVTFDAEDEPALAAIEAFRETLGSEAAERLIGPSAVTTNATRTVVLVPDGSKEGWDDSDRGDERRAEFIKAIRAASDEAEIAEVAFGGDLSLNGRPPTVVEHLDPEHPFFREPTDAD